MIARIAGLFHIIDGSKDKRINFLLTSRQQDGNWAFQTLRFALRCSTSRQKVFFLDDNGN
ncbi:hypothetical protein TH30_00915 [Thalassospira profundimaris]|uniref:Uncharacterized protein n=1 Tax=Thalassospira profundimaris TaxID=502049 RepID=A0A367X5S0_9PROT|nr:hypothetical protein TH30_00915 [Thalassospira profundimaris]